MDSTTRTSRWRIGRAISSSPRRLTGTQPARSVSSSIQGQPRSSCRRTTQVCIGTDYKSLNPGLTRIRLAIKSDSDGEIVYSHQFLVIWLTANKPVLNEAGTSASGTETFRTS